MRVNFYRALIPPGDTQSQLDYVVSDMRRSVCRDFERHKEMLRVIEFPIVQEITLSKSGQEIPGRKEMYLQWRDGIINQMFETMAYEAHVEELELENRSVETSKL